MLDPQVVDDVRYLVPADVSANQFDPAYIDVAERQPGVCALCRSFKGPFIDTRVDTPWGRIYVCTATCGSQIADMCSSQVVEVLNESIDQLHARVASLLQELADAEATRVVPLADVQRLFDRGVTTPVRTPVIPGTCTATRSDGRPCTAKALNGRDVCLAHSKQRVAA